MKQRAASKMVICGALASVVVLATPGQAFAHVVVKPSQALTGAYQTFTASVPNEKEIPVTGLRLVIPDSIESVTPTVKAGWEITTKKSGSRTTEISWTGGTIPAEQRDDFTFSAHLSSKAGEIDWKAYQTYQNGSVVSWDQKPTGSHGHESEDDSRGPYSVTVVSDTDSEANETRGNSSSVVPYVASLVALILSAIALMRTTRK